MTFCRLRPFVPLLVVIGPTLCGGSSCLAADTPAMIRERFEAHDRSIHVTDDWIRDPYVVHGTDGWFYLTGTTQMPDEPATAASRYNVGLGKESLVGWHARAWKTRDFAQWEPLGSVFTLKDGVWFGARPEQFGRVPEVEWRLWAPELHPVRDRWALVHTSPAPVNAANLALSAGPDLTGPWSNPMGEKIGRRHDPSLFQDDDGTWWLIWGAAQIAPLKEDFSDFAADPVEIGPAGEFAKMGHEGCLIRKIAGRYVLFGTGWSTGQMRKGSYNLYYATAAKVTGPYGERKFAGRFLGHGTPFQDDRGRWWCTAFFNADVPPLPREGIAKRDLSEVAQTINSQGTTLVPLEVRAAGGEVIVRAKDPVYAVPGPDERQPFDVAGDASGSGDP